MSVQNGFLALLTQGPAYGSQLQSEFLCRAAHRRQLNPGQVYSTLDRMTDQGLVALGRCDRRRPPAVRADRGRDASPPAAWLTGGPRDGRPDWDEMQDQVLIAASLDGVDAPAIVDGYRAAYAERIRYLSHEADSRALLAANRAAELGAKAAIEWLDEVAATLAAHPGALVQHALPRAPAPRTPAGRRERASAEPRSAHAAGARSTPRTAIRRLARSATGQWSSSPCLLSTFFSPASIGTAKRFCVGGSGQLKL